MTHTHKKKMFLNYVFLRREKREEEAGEACLLKRVSTIRFHSELIS